MKALVLTAYGSLSIADAPVPETREDEVLVRVRACGICGSDVHGMDGSTGRRIPPIIMGHEAAGEIVSRGAGVKGWEVGTRVTFDSTISCGSCSHCKRGEINLCDHRRVLGVSCSEYRCQGAFAEFVAVPERILYRLPPGLSFEKAALAEAVSVAVHSVARTPLARDGTCVVVGSGMIGVLIVQVLRALGCRRVIAVDVDASRLEAAARLGATETVRSGMEDVATRVLSLTGGRGADAAFEVVGVSASLQDAVASVRRGGSVTLVGNLEARSTLPLQSVVTREVTLIGSCASAGEYPQALEMIASGKVDVEGFISAVAPLEEGPGFFERLRVREKGLMKVILTP